MKTSPLNGLKLTRKQMEQRRMLASEDLVNGMSQADVARKYGVYRSSVSRWVKRLEKEGKEGLKEKKAKGQSSKLNSAQKQQLTALLVQGAQACGFETDLWTAKRVGLVIEREFGVVYHFRHIPKLLRSLDFRLVKPDRKAAEKDDTQKEEWLSTTWVHLKKNYEMAQ